MIKYVLVGDVGGINVCFVLCDIVSGEILQVKIYLGFDYFSFEVVICVYFEEYKVEVKDGCIVIVCLIIGDWVVMINYIWVFLIVEMKKNFGFSYLEIINDFIVVLMVILMLKKEYLIQFGGVELVEGKFIVVYGVGMGFGVVYLVYVDKCWVSLSGEGGYVDFVLNSEEEVIIFEILCVEIGYVLVECVFFGFGLVNLYCVIVKVDNCLLENFKLKDIIECVLVDSCIDCCCVLLLFCVIMGCFGGNLVFNFGIFGGVFIVGGIVLCFFEFFKVFGFCVVFEDKGCFKEYVYDILVYFIVYDNLGFFGFGVYLCQILGYIL